MPLLADYAITPDVFDVASYASEEVCGLSLELIREPMLTEGLVRDLRAGEWRGLFADDGRPWHRKGKELVKKLATQSRLIGFQPALPAAPIDDLGWCEEALATHDTLAFTGGVITTESGKNANADDDRVARIDRLGNAKWWVARSPSVRLPRTLAGYTEHLGPILRCSNSILFIDPHLDPAQVRYREFGALIEMAGNRAPTPALEIHRVCYEGSGRERQLPLQRDGAYFRNRFGMELGGRLGAAGLQVEVFIWDDFHDRYLISNLVGVSLPNGFDTTNNVNDITTWSRLGRGERDNVQREFERASHRHVLRDRFTVP